MANVAVRTMIYCKLGEGKGWRRFKPVVGGNNQLRPGFAEVQGVPQKFEVYTYQLRLFEGTRTVYKTIGPDPREARAQQITLENQRRSSHDATAAGLQVVVEEGRKTLKEAVDQFVERAKKRGKMEQARMCRLSLDRLQASAPQVRYVDQVTEDVLLDFHAYLRKEFGAGDRTVANSHKHVKALLLWCCYAGGDQIKKRIGSVPQFDQKKVVAYDLDELSSLYATIESMPPATMPKHRGSRYDARISRYDPRYFYTVLKLIHMTGLREAEAQHLAWTDIDYKREEVTVRMKRDLGFRTKNRKERIVPLPPELAVILRERRKVVPTARLVVGNHSDGPNSSWIHFLKIAAYEAKVTCGHCDWCREYAQTGIWKKNCGCHRWTLHGFRRTFATTLWRTGKFLLTEIQQYLGHQSIQTTMKYVADEKPEDTKAKMRSVVWN